jgi:SAM-dependent methyltransferase
VSPGSIWRSGGDYDISGASTYLRQLGAPFLSSQLAASDELDAERPVLVDFGCWSGRHLRLLERVAESNGSTTGDARERVIGIDEPHARERLEEAMKTYRGFQISDCGIATTGLGTSSVDGGLCWRVLHNLTELGELRDALVEIRRVLKDGAPMVVAVRAAQRWMLSDAPFPVAYRTHSLGTERDDMYFTEAACRTMFPLYGFRVEDLTQIEEGERYRGHEATNTYWMIFLILDKAPGG